MCGIAGRVTWDPRGSVDHDLIGAMTDAVRHRGPDAEGLHVAEGVGLGHRRLSIIDLATGDQPLANEDGTIWTVFNGEIYNFADVRRELESHGHRFSTSSDTEVLVHGYEQWGAALVERLRGMFAFAVWDAPRRRLLLARDRVGVKPLHYAVLNDGIVFGSEIKSLLVDPAVPRAWSPEALDAYLALLYVPAPLTIYRAIRKLPPGHVLVAEGGQVQLSRYWDLPFDTSGGPDAESAWREPLEAQLREAVALRLISDVPLGAFLSGGIDSSLVVAFMKETSAAPVVTTSIGFAERAYDELQHATSVARHLGVVQHTHVVTPDVETLLPTLAWHFDEPFADSSAVPTYYVSAAARAHVTVALSGDGGDELWAGYARHRVEQREHRVRGLLGSASAAVGQAARVVPLGLKGVRSLRHLAHAPEQALALKHEYGMFDGVWRRTLYDEGFRRLVGEVDPLAPFRARYHACRSPDPLDRAMYVDVHTYLPDDILTKVDRMSMAVSLESREPLLDHRLLEFAARVPASLKLRDGVSKFLLRRLLAARLPPSVLARGKQGFEAPIREWLRGPLQPMLQDLVGGKRSLERGVFAPTVVRRLLDEHRRGVADHRHRLWQLLMLELWFERFVDQDGWPAWQGPGTRAAVAAAAPAAAAAAVRGAA
jgi:asparagine synthase (glutamine-hydrolysing)